MLVLTRKLGETIVIKVGDKIIRVLLVEVDRGKARLGVAADRDVIIDREEVYVKRCREAQVSPDKEISVAPTDPQAGHGTG